MVCPTVHGIVIEAREITERKRTEQTLREQERLTRHIADLAPAAITVLDLATGRHSFISEDVVHLHGYTRVDIEGMTDVSFDLLHPEDRRRLNENFEKLRELADGEINVIEYRIRHRNGNWRWLLSRTAAFSRNERDEVRQVVSATFDVTDRKQSEDALRSSEERLRLLIESAEDYAIVTLNGEGRLQSWSRGAERLFGYAEDEVIGQPEEILFRREDRGRGVSDQLMQRAQQEGRAADERYFLRKNGTRFFGSGVMSPLHDHGTPGYARITRDMTERQWAEEALHRANAELEIRVLQRTRQLSALNTVLSKEIGGRHDSERRLRRSETFLAEGQRLSHVGSGSWNVVTGELSWSDEAYRIFGSDPRTVAPSAELFLHIVHPEDRQRVAHVFERVVRERSDYEVECRIVHSNGVVRHVRSVGHPVYNGAGEVIEMLGTVMDITQRVQADQNLVQAQRALAHASRVATMGELIASIAHEVNQPLTAVITNAQACMRWLAMARPDLREANEAARRIVQGAERASSVISGLRAFLGRTQTRTTAVNVNEIISEALDLLDGHAHAHGVSFELNARADLPRVMAERIGVQQVVINLVMNGIEAMTSTTETSKVVTVHTAQHGDRAIVVGVRDSGTGVDEEHSDRIFDAFFTTKAEGLGMGLAISRSIIEAHGGRMWVVPNSDCGVTFHFTLPIGQDVP
jgi:PAS domain S-box-containing protein